MKRREFMTLVGGAAVSWPFAARAQQERMRRVSVLVGIADDAEGQARVAAFQKALRALGWTEGQNVQFDVRFSAGDQQLLQSYAKDIVSAAPDAILVATNPALVALQKQTRTIPIVFAQVSDPVGFGFVATAAKPGGNITGFSHLEYGIAGKWLELLKEISPGLKRVAVMANPSDFAWPGFLRTIEGVAPSLGVQLVPAGVRDREEIARFIEHFAKQPDGGLINLPTPTTAVNRDLTILLAAQYGLPAIYHLRFFATDGGLMSYGVDNIALFRSAASYVDRVLRGSNPGDLPVQFPTKYELVINLKTAKQMRLAIPETIMQRADEVIE